MSVHSAELNRINVLGFAGGLCCRARADAQHLAAALGHAVDSLYQAVEQPVEGTLITLARETSDEAHAVCRETEDLTIFAKRLLQAARSSLERTADLLPVLSEAGVVDAGAKGFVRFLEGVVALIKGGDATPQELGAGAVCVLSGRLALSLLRRGAEQTIALCILLRDGKARLVTAPHV